MPFEGEPRASPSLAAIVQAARIGRVGHFDEVLRPRHVEPVKDAWYFSVECPCCLRVTAAFPDPENGRLERPFAGRGGIETVCHFCSRPVAARPEQIFAFRWWDDSRSEPEPSAANGDGA